MRNILLVEDDSARPHRRTVPGLQSAMPNHPVIVRVHKIVAGEWQTVCSEAPVPPAHPGTGQREYKRHVALRLLSLCGSLDDDPVVVAGASYAASCAFITSLVEQRLDFTIEIRPSHQVRYEDNEHWVTRKAADTLQNAHWSDARPVRTSHSTVPYSVADLAVVSLPDDTVARLFAAQTGGIDGLHRGTIIGLTSMRSLPLEDLVRYIGWVRWIRPVVRRQERQSLGNDRSSQVSRKQRHDLNLQYRSNLTLAKLQDNSSDSDANTIPFGNGPCGRIFANENVLNAVELFAGAGGMGLGFLMAAHPAKRFRLTFVAELHPVYTRTLRNTHAWLVGRQRSQWVDYLPASIEPINLNDRRTLDLVASEVGASGGADIVVGGPPCQGFSNANRNSWSSANPQNQMIDVFMKYVEKLSPSVFLIENVQGIAWTSKTGKTNTQPSVAGYIVERMEKAGYVVFPKLLDAVWYGVPQFRTRFFVVGIHRDVGYRSHDFGDWGPFPTPTHGPLAANRLVTVRDAIGDLPAIGNGHKVEAIDYWDSAADVSNDFLKLMRKDAPTDIITDHVTSRHAEYVIERYRRIPPGGNWQDISEMMSNYSQLERTHSNIYRRLEWDEPSITIGHYRKSMIIHPEQDRGLSLREASRLQSFPDWFRFSGTVDSRPGGLMHKQQQLANAVCPVVSKAIAEFVLEL